MHIFSLQHQGSPDFSELIALVSESLTHNLPLCKAVLPISHGMLSSAKFSNSKGQGQNGNEKAKRSTELILQTAFLNVDIKEFALKWFKFLADFLNDSILVIHFPLSASLAGPMNFSRIHLPYCLSFQDILSLKLPLTQAKEPPPRVLLWGTLTVQCTCSQMFSGSVCVCFTWEPMAYTPTSQGKHLCLSPNLCAKS